MLGVPACGLVRPGLSERRVQRRGALGADAVAMWGRGGERVRCSWAWSTRSCRAPRAPDGEAREVLRADREARRQVRGGTDARSTRGSANGCARIRPRWDARSVRSPLAEVTPSPILCFYDTGEEARSEINQPDDARFPLL